MRLSLKLILLVTVPLLLQPRAVQAAEDYGNCTGTIASLPAVVSASGTWCVEQNLSTSVTSGNVIDIQADNVTIDCNDFKVDGSGAGAGTTARGIFASNRFNVAVRHCQVLGFRDGILLTGTSHKVEDNRLEGNRCYGIYVYADGSVVQRNRVFNTGGSSTTCDPTGIAGLGPVDILDNTVAGVTATSGGNRGAYGIVSFVDPGGNIVGNRIRGVVKDGSGHAYGIETENRENIRANDLVGDGSAGSTGLYCFLSTGRARDNVISGFEAAVTICTLSVGNVSKP
jgi:parallel beta-helix repeat protein